MKCRSVDCQRLPAVTGRYGETGLWNEPPGTWRWRLDGPGGARVLEVVLPSAYPPGPGVVHPYQIAHCEIAEGRWKWDGNESKPTLDPSILVDTLWGEDRARVYWHGHMRAGRLEACE